MYFYSQLFCVVSFYADDPERKSADNGGLNGVVYTRTGGQRSGGGAVKEPEGGNNRETILYTDITAAVYQEFTVLKKNKFGRVQERIMGIDSSKIYNYETQTRNAASVRHAQRNISTVLKIEYVDGGENRKFKIVFAGEGRDPSYEIEYQCATSRSCAEIVSKIRYLLGARDSASSSSAANKKR